MKNVFFSLSYFFLCIKGTSSRSKKILACINYIIRLFSFSQLKKRDDTQKTIKNHSIYKCKCMMPPYLTNGSFHGYCFSERWIRLQHKNRHFTFIAIDYCLTLACCRQYAHYYYYLNSFSFRYLLLVRLLYTTLVLQWMEAKKKGSVYVSNCYSCCQLINIEW